MMFYRNSTYILTPSTPSPPYPLSLPLPTTPVLLNRTFEVSDFTFFYSHWIYKELKRRNEKLNVKWEVYIYHRGLIHSSNSGYNDSFWYSSL